MREAERLRNAVLSKRFLGAVPKVVRVHDDVFDPFRDKPFQGEARQGPVHHGR